MKSRSIIFLILTIVVTSCMPDRYTETRLSISSESAIPVTIIIYAQRKPDWNGIFTFLESKAHLYDYRVEGSPVCELNSTQEAQLPDEVFHTIGIALEIAEKSNGAFDPTILPLIQLWNFDSAATKKIPDPQEISTAMSHIDYTKVVLSGNNRVTIPEEFGIDLGGIAKGALVDSLADYLNSLGYENFLIEAGGDLIISGLKPGGKKWIVGIRHPRKEDDLVGELSFDLSNGVPNSVPENRISVVTSGDYERYFEQDGIRYHHIIDPHTGYPVKNMVSVTIITPACIRADALATAVFVLGKEEGLKLLENEKDTEGLLIYEEDGNLKSVMTGGFPKFLSRFAL